MTYNSTLANLFAAGFRELEPRIGSRVVRRLVLSPIVYELCSDESVAKRSEFPQAKVLAKLEDYLLGNLVKVAITGQKVDADFKRLRNVGELLCIRTKIPKKNQWRIFGFFLEPDVFVALGAARRDLLNEGNYDAFVKNVRKQFESEFPDVEPVIFADAKQYISGNIIDLSKSKSGNRL